VKRWLGLLGLIACGVALPADDAALRTVESCRARLDARVDIGIERIQKRCPDLMPALASAPWRDLLPLSMRERREEITAESLRALAELVRQSRDAASRRAAPTRDHLVPVLANLDDQGEQPVTRWERFKRWLKDKLENRQDDDDAGWLDKFARQFKTSEGVAQFITYTGYALVGVLVAVVIWSEVRAAGFLGGVRRVSARQSPAAEWRRRLLLVDVAKAPLAERPGMLLRLLGEALTRAQRLPAAEGLTASAIAERARLDSGDEREALRAVGATAETVRFAAASPPEAEIEGTVVTAKALLERFVRQGSR